MGVVNRYARGLLSLLDSQTQGQAPSSMGEQIVPTFDMQEFLYASKGLEVQAITETSAPAALGIYGVLRVPAGEMWVIRRVTVQVNNNDAGVVLGTIKFYPVAVTGAAQVPMSLMTGWSVAGASIQASATRQEAAPLYYPLVLNENSYVALRIESVAAFAGADPTYTVAAQLHRLSV